MIRSDPEKTAARFTKLDEYMSAHVLRGREFRCKHFEQCRSSRADFPYYEGQLPHLGRHYDLEVDGRPMRIVLVGQEYGHAPALAGLADRSAMIAASAQKGFPGRNPHMKGTTSLLRLLLGREPGVDREGEQLFEGAHVFDGFALVNYLLCSAVRESRSGFGKNFTGGARGHSSPVMRANCAGHFLRTLEILEPTLIVAQGQGVRRWMALALGLPTRGQVVERVVVAEHEVDLLTFNHPSAGGNSGYWGASHQSRYLVETVAPTVRAYRASRQLPAADQ